MTTSRTARFMIASFVLLTLAGCAAPAPVDDEPVGQSGVGAEDQLPTDEEMCWRYADVLTLVGNMRMANDQGRLIGNEWDGILRLAMRQVDSIEVDDTTEVGAAIAAQQQSIGDAHGGMMSSAVPELVDTWTYGAMSDPVQVACYAAVTDWGVEGWVGG